MVSSQQQFMFARPSPSWALFPPDLYSLGMFRVVAIRVEPKATTEACVVADFVLGSALQESDNLAVSATLFPKYFGE